jgi:predicted P-loop ATPase
MHRSSNVKEKAMPLHGFAGSEDTVRQLFVKKLASSGITPEQGVALGMKPLLAQGTNELGYWKKLGLPGLHIQYFDPWTDEPVEMHRVRCLIEPKPLPKGFPKYLQPAEIGAIPYFPKGPDWSSVLADPTVPLIITEGELKAASAVLRGFTTIALAGVWCFRQGDKGEENDQLLPELAAVTWADRRVTIVFDSDVSRKPEVWEAPRRLANQLIGAGAEVFKVLLPSVVKGGKTGLDDLLITKGGPAKLRELIKRAEPLSLMHVDSPDKDWAASLQRSSGAPLTNLRNALIALRRAPVLAGLVAFDEMLQATMVMRDLTGSHLAEVTAPRRQTDNDVLAIQEWMQRHELSRISEGVVRQAMTKAAEEHRFHPIRNTLNTLRWDGKKRTGSWLARYLGASDTKYHAEVGKMFLISMVARVMKPGCKCDYMLILEGDQGILKSTVCRILSGDDYFSDSLPRLRYADEKRLSAHLRGKWLIEVSELSTFSKAETHELKAFLTRQDEQFTAMYGRTEVKEPRQCVFIGTTNEDYYLRDETGDRRSWPVKGGDYKIEDLRRDRNQLLAEAVVEYRAGAQWWPHRDFEATIIKPEQEARFVEDVWAAPISELADMFIKGRPVSSVTIMKIAELGLGLSDKSRVGPQEASRIRAILKRTGWKLDRHHTKAGQAWLPPGGKELKEAAVTRKFRVVK